MNFQNSSANTGQKNAPVCFNLWLWGTHSPSDIRPHKFTILEFWGWLLTWLSMDVRIAAFLKECVVDLSWFLDAPCVSSSQSLSVPAELQPLAESLSASLSPSESLFFSRTLRFPELCLGGQFPQLCYGHRFQGSEHGWTSLIILPSRICENDTPNTKVHGVWESHPCLRALQ